MDIKKTKLFMITISFISLILLVIMHFMTNYINNERVQMYFYGLRLILLFNCFIIIRRFKIKKSEIGFLIVILGFLLEFIGDYVFLQDNLRDESLLFVLTVGSLNIFGLIILIHGISQTLKKITNLTHSLEHLAFYDQLTGLKNRNYLIAGNQGAFDTEIVEYDLPKLIKSKQAAILFLDIDDFKLINDFAGHAGGDKILKVTASRLESFIGNEDNLVIRISGDEFLIIINHYVSNDTLEIQIKAMQRELNQVIHLKDKKIKVSTSIGYALYPEHGAELETLMRKADIAMYHAKRKSKNNYCLFSDDLEVEFNQQFHHIFNDSENNENPV
jgi:diguanylate cyclase (GGDEF)-like protein